MSESKGKVSSKRSLRTKYKALDNKFKVLVVFGILFCAFGVGMGIWGSVWAYNEFVIGGDDVTPEETPTTRLTSTFTLSSGVDGEDVSSFVEMDIWKPKSTATFDEGYEDITDMTNFERTVTGKDADDISIDLRDESWYWAEITGNSVYNNTFHLLIGGLNFNYLINVHDTSTDVNFNILDDNMNELQYGTHNDTLNTKGVDANYTVVMKPPHLTKATTTWNQVHYGDNWAMSTTDFAELTQRQKEIYWNELYWADQYPTYNPTLDTSNEYDRDFEKLTNTYAIKWTMNATIVATDGAATEINCTIAKGFPVEVWTSGVHLYMAWHEGFDFDPSPYAMMFEMSFGAAINVTTVINGRANVFGSLSTLTWSETYSTIGA